MQTDPGLHVLRAMLQRDRFMKGEVRLVRREREEGSPPVNRFPQVLRKDRESRLVNSAGSRVPDRLLLNRFRICSLFSPANTPGGSAENTLDDTSRHVRAVSSEKVELAHPERRLLYSCSFFSDVNPAKLPGAKLPENELWSNLISDTLAMEFKTPGPRLPPIFKLL